MHNDIVLLICCDWQQHICNGVALFVRIGIMMDWWLWCGWLVVNHEIHVWLVTAMDIHPTNRIHTHIICKGKRENMLRWTSISEIDDWTYSLKYIWFPHYIVSSVLFSKIYLGVEICCRMKWPIFSTLKVCYEASLAEHLPHSIPSLFFSAAVRQMWLLAITCYAWQPTPRFCTIGATVNITQAAVAKGMTTTGTEWCQLFQNPVLHA